MIVCNAFYPILLRAFAVVSASSSGVGESVLLGKCKKMAGLWSNKKALPPELLEKLGKALTNPQTVISVQPDSTTLQDLVKLGGLERGDGKKAGSGIQLNKEKWEDDAAVSITLLEQELRAAGTVLRQEPIDTSKRLRATVEGRALDDAQQRVESSLKSVEAAEIQVRMAVDEVGSIPVLLKRAFIYQEGSPEEKSLEDSHPFDNLSSLLKSSQRYVAALKAEKKARHEAIDALSVHIQNESDDGNTVRWEKRIAAYMEGIKTVKAKISEAVNASPPTTSTMLSSAPVTVVSQPTISGRTRMADPTPTVSQSSIPPRNTTNYQHVGNPATQTPLAPVSFLSGILASAVSAGQGGARQQQPLHRPNVNGHIRGVDNSPAWAKKL